MSASPAPRVRPRPELAEHLPAALGAALLVQSELVEEASITVARETVADVLTKLRDEFDYQQLMEIAGVDYPDRPERFEVVYHLLSVTRNHRLRVRVITDEVSPVPSVTDVYPSAGWLEREVFDMYGVLFSGNPDLRRILTDYGFSGHPFRKDFPLTGYVELRYSEAEKRVVYDKVELAQDFRQFDFLSPWEGAQYALPGDEKAEGQAPGAPTPASAAEAKGATAPPPAAPPPKPKVTDTPAETGADKGATATTHAQAAATPPITPVGPAADAPAKPAGDA